MDENPIDYEERIEKMESEMDNQHDE